MKLLYVQGDVVKFVVDHAHLPYLNFLEISVDIMEHV